MGTRNLIAIVKNGVVKLAQYAQWDGYPTGEGQGNKIRKFLIKTNLEEFSQKVDTLSWASEDYIDDQMSMNGLVSGLMTYQESQKFNALFPEWGRDIGSDILQLIMDRSNLKVVDCSEFIQDKTSCEWAYVIDMDSHTLSIFKSGSKIPNKYFDGGIGLYKEISFESLPDNDDDWNTLFEKEGD